MRNSRDRKRRRRPVAFSLATLRLREIERLIRSRHLYVPNTDDADIYLVPAAQLLRRIVLDKFGQLTIADIIDRLEVWAPSFAPQISAETLESVARYAMGHPILANADTLAAQLRLTYEERARLRITTIGACDVNRAGRASLRKERKRLRDRARALAKRAACGAIPRAKYLANSLSRARPWEAEGISRSTWERRRKAAFSGEWQTQGDASPSPSILTYLGGDGLASRQSKPRLPEVV